MSLPGKLKLGGAIALLWISFSAGRLGAAQVPAGRAAGPASSGRPGWIAPEHVAAVDAARLYVDACAPCHGRGGDGKARGASRLGPARPRDFTAGVFKFRGTPSGSLPTDEDLYRSISRGVPGTWMPGWEALLGPAERWALVAYIKGFAPLFAEEAPEPPISVPAPPARTRELVGEGRWVYTMLRCTQCHGARGRGDGPSAGGLTDDWGAAIEAYDFTRGGYKNGSSPADVYRTLVTGLSGTPMPALEPAAVTFAGGADAPLGRLAQELGARELRELREYLAGQPGAAELARMGPEQSDSLVQHRLWALVYYLESLGRPRTWIYRLLAEPPDLQRSGRP